MFHAHFCELEKLKKPFNLKVVLGLCLLKEINFVIYDFQWVLS